MHPPLMPIHTYDDIDTYAHYGSGNLVNDNDGDNNENDKDHCRVNFDHDDALHSDRANATGGDGTYGGVNDAASDHDNTDSVSFIHGWQSWKAHQLCSALHYTILENHHSGDQSWRGNEKWFLHPDDALTLREVRGRRPSLLLIYYLPLAESPDNSDT